METQTALLILVILAAVLVAAAILFLVRLTKTLGRIEEAVEKIESSAIPLVENLRKISDEVEPVVRRTAERYTSLADRMDALARSPILSFFSPLLRGKNPLSTGKGLFRIARGLSAGLSRAREVLNRRETVIITPDHPYANPAQETNHGQRQK
ncbi:MAG: hypothetical protein ACP5OP_05225 [Leptospirillia bacterium]